MQGGPEMMRKQFAKAFQHARPEHLICMLKAVMTLMLAHPIYSESRGH